jgi:hypothetical protein
MRVTIEQTAWETGLLFKRISGYWVKVQCELSAEERAIVDTRKLWDFVVIKKKNPFWEHASERGKEIRDEWYQYTIADFAKGTKSLFETPSQAKDFAEALREDFQKLKNFIFANAALGTTQTFEL